MTNSDPQELARSVCPLFRTAAEGHHPDSCQICERFVQALLSFRTEEVEVDKACPCLHTTPCSPGGPGCTCVQPFSSAGCLRCCTYGSPEQQREAAEMLVGTSLFEQVRKLRKQMHADHVKLLRGKQYGGAAAYLTFVGELFELMYPEGSEAELTDEKIDDAMLEVGQIGPDPDVPLPPGPSVPWPDFDKPVYPIGRPCSVCGREVRSSHQGCDDGGYCADHVIDAFMASLRGSKRIDE